ncbi:MAG: SWIM zinc finger family protein, partial [Deltaproteobacteria bacterium]|nr:SWIM zinc finger family protein [Deltaproteobacteria bacterium]
MNLASRCRHEFAPGIRGRGEDYFRTRRVSSPERNLDRVKFNVRGSGSVYEVFIDWMKTYQTGKLLVSCTCPYFVGEDYCKHIWACILQLDQFKLGILVPGKDMLELDIVEKTEIFKHNLQSTSSPHPVDNWKGQLELIRTGQFYKSRKSFLADEYAQRLAFYVLNIPMTYEDGDLVINFWMKEKNEQGHWGDLKPTHVSENLLYRYQDKRDRELLTFLLDECDPRFYKHQRSSQYNQPYHTSQVNLEAQIALVALPMLCETNRFFASEKTRENLCNFTTPLKYCNDSSWKCELVVKTEQEHYELTGRLYKIKHKHEKIYRNINEPLCISNHGFVVFQDSIEKFNSQNSFQWISYLRSQNKMIIPKNDGSEFIKEIHSNSLALLLDLPKELQWRKEHIQPQVRIVFSEPLIPEHGGKSYLSSWQYALSFEFEFEYDGFKDFETLGEQDGQIIDEKNQRIILRDQQFEKSCFKQLENLDF